MNPDRKLYGRITINGNHISLGYSDFSNLLLRANTQFSKFKSPNGRVDISIQVSATQIIDKPQTELERLENEFTSMIAAPDDDSPFEGIKMSRVVEAMASREYELWAMLAQNPSKRIGVSHEDIEAARRAYVDLFPDCAPFFPLYVE